MHVDFPYPTRALAMLSAQMFPMHFSVFKGHLTDNLTTGCIQQDWTVCPTQGKLKDFLKTVLSQNNLLTNLLI
jgi:hypothetical protein